MNRLTRVIGVLAVPLLLMAGCSSGDDSAVSSTPVTSSSAKPTPSLTPAPSPTPAPPPAPEPPPPTDPLTGGPPVQGPVIAVKIDNTSAGLPQYGVAGADIVYVEQVEGGLTRLMSVFHTNLPSEVPQID